MATHQNIRRFNKRLNLLNPYSFFREKIQNAGNFNKTNENNCNTY